MVRRTRRLYGRGRRGVNHANWLFGDDDPADDVGHQPGAAEDQQQQPDHADQRDVEIEVVGDGGADAGDFAIHSARAHEAMPDGDVADTASAVGTMNGVVLNDLTAVVAVHIRSPLINTMLRAKSSLHAIRRAHVTLCLVAKVAGGAGGEYGFVALYGVAAAVEHVEHFART